MTTGILAQLNHEPPWSVFVPSGVQSEIENVMTMLGFGSTEYDLRMVNMELYADDMTKEVTFEWTGAHINANDWNWIDGIDDMAADIEVIVEDAIKNKEKSGEEWTYPFRCNKSQALYIERITRELSEHIEDIEDVDSERRRALLKEAADRIKVAVGE